MAYTKQIWKKGDIVTPTRLNHMEDGIEAASNGKIGVVHVTENGDAFVLDKNYNEISSMLQNYELVVLQGYSSARLDFVTTISTANSKYYVDTYYGNGNSYESTSPTGTLIKYFVY